MEKKLPSTYYLVVLFFLSFINFTAVAHNDQSAFGKDKSLEFIENHNQWDSSIKYKAALPGGQLYLKQNKWIYDFIENTPIATHGKPAKQQKNYHAKGHAYAVTFLNANPKTALSPAGETPGYRNYFLGNDPSKWASQVPAFEAVEYKDIYPGIDIKLYENKQKLKYDFILQAGIEPGIIKMQYEGPDNMKIEEGNLIIKTSINTVTEQKPYAYQLINGVEKEVSCQFKLDGNTVSFVFPNGLDKKQPLIIDPTLTFSSYSGSATDNWGFTATYDDNGNLYSGGIVFNNGFPVTLGAYQPTFSGTPASGTGVDIAIIKYNPNASGAASRVYATYLGGSFPDVPHSLVVNGQGELLILGTTGSSNFPLSTINGAYDNSFNAGSAIDPLDNLPNNNLEIDYRNGSDLFVSKLNVSGTQLLGSTYLGGTGNDGLLNLNSDLTRNYGDQFRGDIITDALDNIYLVSSTLSQNFPTKNAFQPSPGGVTGTTDAVVCKLTPNLTNLLWGTYFGGNGEDAAYSIQLDNQFNVYICGGTTSSNLAQTAGAFKPSFTFGQDNVDGFACKISTNSTNLNLVRTTYISASSGYDQTYFLQLDAFNNVYLLGQSAGNYPVSAGVFSTSVGRQFIQKLNSDLTASIFSTRFGSSNGLFNISPTAFLVDNCERIYVCGWGGSANAPTTNNYVGGNTSSLPLPPSSVNVAQRSTDGSDFYLMQLSQNASQLDYATYMGGASSISREHVDGGTSRFDKRGFIYQAVCGGCGGNNAFPTTPNAWSTTNQSSNCNNAAFKFDFALQNAIAGGKQTVCASAAPFMLTGATPAGGIWSGTGVNANGLFTPAPNLVGPQFLTYTVTIGNCVSRATKVITVLPLPQVSFSGLSNTEYCLDSSPATLVPSLQGGAFSGPGITNSTTWSATVAGPGQHVIAYTYADANGCVVVVTDTANVQPIPSINVGPAEDVCILTASKQLTATPAGGVWSGPGVSADGIFKPSISLMGVNTLLYSYSQNGCNYTTEKKITVVPAPIAKGSVLSGICKEDNLIFGYAPLEVKFVNNNPEAESYFWNFGDSTSSTDPNPSHTYQEPGKYVVKISTNFEKGCISSAKVAEIIVKPAMVPNIITPNKDGLNETFRPMVSCLPVSFKLFSRWGHLVYKKDNYDDSFTGLDLSAGTYYYLLQSSNGQKWKGWLEISK